MNTRAINSLGARWVPLIFMLGGLISQVDAQTVAATVDARLSASVSAGPRLSDLRDAELQGRVSAALHAEPYLYDRHIDISVRGGAVVLSGIVYDDVDLEDALRTARGVAGTTPVVDRLSIERQARH